MNAIIISFGFKKRIESKQILKGLLSPLTPPSFSKLRTKQWSVTQRGVITREASRSIGYSEITNFFLLFTYFRRHRRLNWVEYSRWLTSSSSSSSSISIILHLLDKSGGKHTQREANFLHHRHGRLYLDVDSCLDYGTRYDRRCWWYRLPPLVLFVIVFFKGFGY